MLGGVFFFVFRLFVFLFFFFACVGIEGDVLRLFLISFI